MTSVAGGTQLCLLLLLGAYTLAQQDAASPDEYSCRLARRYKNFRRYVYDYEATSVNTVNGASEQKSGPKINCKVEFDVPQACSFIMRTTDCSLMEISGLDSSGNTIYLPAPGAEAFRDEMAKNPLKFQVSELGPLLYPEEDESKNILNIKRGIISTLMVPPREDLPVVVMPTAQGHCATEVTEKARDESSSEITVRRDLTQCGLIQKQHTSPLALLSGMNFPLASLVSSEQICDYRFDNQKRHMSAVSCSEKHLFLPFSHDNKYGISTQVQTTMSLREVSKINDRVFEYNEAKTFYLQMEEVDDKSPVQTKDAAMSTFQELLSLKASAEEDQRPMLFRRLLLELRGLKGDSADAAALDMFQLSQRVSLQALVQCGSPECLSALLKVLRTFPHEALEVDALVYGLSMLPNPSPRLLSDLLEMAKYKQSKAIMYALGNTANKLASAQGLVPEVRAVYDFFMSILGADCAGDKEITFLTLRVVGNLGQVLEAVDPSIKGTLLKCMRQPATTLSVQLAAIQAFRRMDITDEVRANLQRVSQYPKGAVQKRLAAYLMLMRSYQDSDIEMIKKLMEKEQNVQVKSFITSHVYNILFSTDDNLQELRSKLEAALQGMDLPDMADYSLESRKFKLPGVQGNIIFDASSQLPREVLLETTLEAFGYKMDLFEVGMEGKGFEPTVEALFGQNGFFPDTISKALYWAEEKVNPSIKELLNKWAAPLKIQGQTVSDDLIREVVRNFNKLMKDLQNADAPDAMAYLRVMGSELGFIKTNELESVVQNVMMYSEILMYIMPRDMIFKSFMNGDNDLFAHYMFLDNKFFLPTAAGLPLRFHMTGTFTPGLKGKVTFDPQMKELLFRPSAGVEFMTKMGIHVPEFVESSVEMTTNIFHESSFHARVSMERGQIKVSMPAPTDTIKLLNIRNEVRIMGVNNALLIQPTQTEVSCSSRVPGMKLCFTVSGAESGPNQPYFPLNGASQYLVNIRPVDEVVEYTATISYSLLNEGKDGRQKVDSVKVALKAEGDDEPMEASLLMKYNRNRNMLTSQLQVPDLDMEAGVKLGMTDSSSRGKALLLEISNKNVPQLSLIGRAKLQAGLSDGMVQLQMLVPSLSTDASLTANINAADGLMLELKSDIKLPETTSLQSITFKMGEAQAEVKLMSNVNAETAMLEKYNEAAQDWLKLFMSDVMEQRVVNTDMKVRHIINKGLEAGTIWMDKFKGDFPYVETLKDKLSNMEMPALPEKLFMNFESALTYNFNKDTMIIFVPLPYGGKSSEELRIPTELSTPSIRIPQLNMYADPKTIRIPAFTIPSEYEVSVPLMGNMEMNTRMESNLYNWEALVTVGNYTVDSPSYKAEYSIKGESPITLLSFSNAGTAELFEEFNGVTTSLFFGMRHELLRSEIKIRNNFGITDNIWSGGRIIMTAKGPGVDTSLSTSAQFTLAPAMLSGDVNSDASMTIGPIEATCTSQNTFSFEPAKKEAKAESTVRFNSDIVKLANKIKMSYADSELVIDSNTNMNSEPLKHTTKISVVYKDVKLSIQSDSVTKASEEKMLRSQMELLASGEQVTLRIENQADDSSNRAYSLLTGSLTPSGLEVNSDASVNIFANLASHKATLTFDSNGLTTSCTTTAQLSPFTFENVFHAGADSTGATMSLTTKGGIRENKAELNVEGKIASSEVYLNSIAKGNIFDLNGRNRVNLRLNEDGLIASNNMVASYNEISTKNSHTLSLNMRSLTLQSKTDNFLNSRNTYMHDVTVNVERFATNMIMKNEMKVMNVEFNNDAQFKALPYTMELVGTTMGKHRDEEVRHTYEVKFVDMILSTKCNTNGKLFDYHITHAADMEMSGLAMKFNDVVNMNSPFLRMDSTIKANAEPFSLNVDAICNSNADFHFFGGENGQMYSKFLMKAEPLMFTHSFEQRASASIKTIEGDTFQSSMDNKFDSLLTLKEQSLNLKVTSNLNEHTFNQELNAFNNAEKVGIEMSTAASTSLFAKRRDDYSVSGFIIYEKNGESHIMIPFVEHLPAVVENIRNTMMRLLDQGISAVKDINNKYRISERLTGKVAELKEVIDNFDANLFIQDVKKFLSSIESSITNLTRKFPTDKVVAMLKSIKEMIMNWIKKYNITERINIIYGKMEEILSNYEVEKMIGALMDEVVKIMKQYQVREKIQAVFTAIKSIDIKPIVKRVILPIQGLVNELYAVDFKQFVEDFNDFVLRMLQKIRSFDYETFSSELTDTLKEMSAVPCLGKLSGEVKVSSPLYKMTTNVNFENNTVSADTPDFLFSLKSNADSTLKPLEYTLEASANVALPRMSHFAFTESIKFDHYAFQLDHQESMNIYRHSALGSAETTAKADTELYKGEFINKASLTMENGLSSKVETNYKHELQFKPVDVITSMALTQMTTLELQDGSATLKMENSVDGKVNSDEANHKSDMEAVLDFQTVKIAFNGATGCAKMKVTQMFDADISIFQHCIASAKMETEAPFLKSSLAEAKFQARVEDMTIDFSASHNAELIGNVEGTVANSFVASVTPDDVTFDAKNKANAKLALPFKLTGKTDLQNDYSFSLNPMEQRASWTGLARFNQYRYSHFFSMDNGEKEMNIMYQINGEANLDMLKEKITIPRIDLPYIGVRIRRMEDVSLWEDVGLGDFFITSQQTLDINSNFNYVKNPDMIVINIEPVINAINTNGKALHKHMLTGKDKAAAVLAQSYGKAKEEYEKYSVQLPKAITIPAYRIPVMDVEMSTYTIPLPDASLVAMPSFHVPSALSKMTIPKITLPRINSIKIPRMGEVTYEFSMKTAMLTLKTNAGLFNNENAIGMKLDASCTSEFEYLSGDIEGSASIKTNDGLRVDSNLVMNHVVAELKHNNAMILSPIMDMDMINSAALLYGRYDIVQKVNKNQGMLVSLSIPSGIIGAQVYPKSLTNMMARVYGQYPSEEEMDIMAVQMSLGKGLNIQTNWNMEIPYNTMLTVKEEMPRAVAIFVRRAGVFYRDISRDCAYFFLGLTSSVEAAIKNGKAMFRQAVETIATMEPSEFLTTLTDDVLLTLKNCRSRVEMIFDAVVKFLRETKFQIPGYEERMTGSQLYEICVRFFADLSEEAIDRIPQYFSALFTPMIEYFKSLEFQFSNHVVRGSEIIEDFTVAFSRLQDQIKVIVRKIGSFSLEELMTHFNALSQFILAQGEKLLEAIRFVDVDGITNFFSDVYRDAVESEVMKTIVKQCKQIYLILREYYRTVEARVQAVLDEFSIQQLNNDMVEWMDRMIKNMNAFQNNVIETLKEESKSIEPYVKVGDRNMEIDIPFPFVN